MLKVKTCLVSEGISVDRETGETSLFNLIDGFATPGFPVFVRQVVFFVQFERQTTDPTDYTLDFSIELNGQQLMSQGAQPLNFGASANARALVKIRGLVIPGPGRIGFKIALADNLLAEYAIDAVAVPAVAAAVQQTPQLTITPH